MVSCVKKGIFCKKAELLNDQRIPCLSAKNPIYCSIQSLPALPQDASHTWGEKLNLIKTLIIESEENSPPDKELHLAAFGTPWVRRGHTGGFRQPETLAVVTHDWSLGREISKTMGDLGAARPQLPQICMTCIHMHGKNNII